jgi:hypothetical protein
VAALGTDTTAASDRVAFWKHGFLGQDNAITWSEEKIVVGIRIAYTLTASDLGCVHRGNTFAV